MSHKYRCPDCDEMVTQIFNSYSSAGAVQRVPTTTYYCKHCEDYYDEGVLINDEGGEASE